MSSIKAIPFLVIFSIVTGPHVAASEHEPLVTLTDDCVIDANPCISADGQFAIDYLANLPDANYFWPIAAGVATLVPLALAIIPGPTVCALVKGSSACALTAAETGIAGALGTLGGVVGSYTLWTDSRDDAAMKEQSLKLAQLIQDAYQTEREINTNSVAMLLTQYQTARPTESHFPIDLAEKIVLANEAGLFVPEDVFLAMSEPRLSRYAHCLDLPIRKANLQGLELGTLFDKSPLEVVGILIAMEKEDLERKKLAFTQAAEDWQQQVTQYLENIVLVNQKKSLNQCSDNNVN